MGQNDKGVCKSDRCCCQLISKCEEKPAVATPKPRNVCGGREERPEMSICDFLKSQPTPEWIKVSNGRPQHGRSSCVEAKDSKGRQRGPCGQAPPSSNCSGKNRTTYVHRPKPQPEWVRSTEQVCVPNNGGMYQSQHRYRNDQQPQPTTCETDDRQLSQIIINFGTVVTGEMCKPDDSGQQTNSEVQDVSLEKKRRTCKTTARPQPDRSTRCTRAPADRSISTCPADERSTSTGLPDRSSCTRAPDDRPIPTCPPPDRSSCTRALVDHSVTTCSPPDRPARTRGPAERSTSTCPPDCSSCTRDPDDRPIPTCPPPDRSSCTRAIVDRSVTTCSPPDRPARTHGPAERSTSTCPPDRSSCTRIDRSTSTSPLPDRSNCTRTPADRSTRGSHAPTNRSNSSYPPVNRSTLTHGPADHSSSTGLPANFSTCTRAPVDRSTFSCPQVDGSSFTLPQATSTFIRPSADRPKFTCPQADRNNHSISTRLPSDWSTSTRSLAYRSNSVRPPNVRPPNVRPPNVRPNGMESNMTARRSYSRYQDNPSTQQRAHSESGMKSKSACYCDNNN